jgi:hypothetical protein
MSSSIVGLKGAKKQSIPRAPTHGFPPASKPWERWAQPHLTPSTHRSRPPFNWSSLEVDQTQRAVSLSCTPTKNSHWLNISVTGTLVFWQQYVLFSHLSNSCPYTEIGLPEISPMGSSFSWTVVQNAWHHCPLNVWEQISSQSTPGPSTLVKYVLIILGLWIPLQSLVKIGSSSQETEHTRLHTSCWQALHTPALRANGPRLEPCIESKARWQWW